jgi:hypothetical protein
MATRDWQCDCGKCRDCAVVPVVDQVDHPTHYTKGKFEVIDVIEDWQLGFHLGNVIKYVARSAHKGSTLKDLKKARWYLDRAISKLEQQA